MTPERSAAYWQLAHNARYAQRLCERTARLYRRMHTVSTFLGVISGSASASALALNTPPWIPVAGAIALAVVGAAHLAIRPAERAAQNEGDVRKYAELQAKALAMSDEEFAMAMAAARSTDVPEIEPLRDVAYNDVVAEVGRPDLQQPLHLAQRLLAAVA
jgi:hypothetical protein